jgi:hypothetical protein
MCYHLLIHLNTVHMHYSYVFWDIKLIALTLANIFNLARMQPKVAFLMKTYDQAQDISPRPLDNGLF